MKKAKTIFSSGGMLAKTMAFTLLVTGSRGCSGSGLRHTSTKQNTSKWYAASLDKNGRQRCWRSFE